MAVPASKPAFQTALAAPTDPGPAASKARSMVRFCSPPYPAPTSAHASTHGTSWAGVTGARTSHATAARPTTATTTNGQRSRPEPTRSATAPIRHRVRAEVTLRASSPTVASQPAATTCGANVIRAPPASVIASSIVVGAASPSRAARVSRVPGAGAGCAGSCMLRWGRCWATA